MLFKKDRKTMKLLIVSSLRVVLFLFPGCNRSIKLCFDWMNSFLKDISLSSALMCVCVCVCAHTCAHSVMFYSLQPHDLQPTRLLCPWKFPGKNARVGFHFLLQGTYKVLKNHWLSFIRNSWASLIVQLVKNLPAMQETTVRFLGQEDPLAKG